MDQVSLEQRLSDLAIGPIYYHAQIGSTNTEAAGLADQDAPHLSLVIADEQTAGRGRLNRRWFTPPAAALAFSLIIRPTFAALQSEDNSSFTPIVQRMTALAALSVCQALEKSLELAPLIKWPNDVLLERRKTCGILTEAHWQGDRLDAVILGVGINVLKGAVPPDQELIYPATSLETVFGKPVERLDILHGVLENLIDWLPRLAEQAFIQAWERRLAFRGEWVSVFLDLTSQTGQAQADLEAEVLGLALDGALRLRTKDGQVITINTGELRLRPTR